MLVLPTQAPGFLPMPGISQRGKEQWGGCRQTPFATRGSELTLLLAPQGFRMVSQQEAAVPSPKGAVGAEITSKASLWQVGPGKRPLCQVGRSTRVDLGSLDLLQVPLWVWDFLTGGLKE